MKVSEKLSLSHSEQDISSSLSSTGRRQISTALLLVQNNFCTKILIQSWEWAEGGGRRGVNILPCFLSVLSNFCFVSGTKGKKFHHFLTLHSSRNVGSGGYSDMQPHNAKHRVGYPPLEFFQWECKLVKRWLRVDSRKVKYNVFDLSLELLAKKFVIFQVNIYID